MISEALMGEGGNARLVNKNFSSFNSVLFICVGTGRDLTGTCESPGKGNNSRTPSICQISFLLSHYIYLPQNKKCFILNDTSLNACKYVAKI